MQKETQNRVANFQAKFNMQHDSTIRIYRSALLYFRNIRFVQESIRNRPDVIFLYYPYYIVLYIIITKHIESEREKGSIRESAVVYRSETPRFPKSETRNNLRRWASIGRLGKREGWARGAGAGREWRERGTCA